jgi:hypothetical protein
MDDRNEELRDIMRANKLKVRDVAKMLGRAQVTVRIWLCQGPKSSREIPAETLELLKLKLAAQRTAK